MHYPWQTHPRPLVRDADGFVWIPIEATRRIISVPICDLTFFLHPRLAFKTELKKKKKNMSLYIERNDRRPKTAGKTRSWSLHEGRTESRVGDGRGNVRPENNLLYCDRRFNDNDIVTIRRTLRRRFWRLGKKKIGRTATRLTEPKSKKKYLYRAIAVLANGTETFCEPLSRRPLLVNEFEWMTHLWVSDGTRCLYRAAAAAAARAFDSRFCYDALRTAAAFDWPRFLMRPWSIFVTRDAFWRIGFESNRKSVWNFLFFFKVAVSRISHPTRVKKQKMFSRVLRQY